MIKYIILSSSNPESTFDIEDLNIEDLNCVSCEWEVYDTFRDLDKAVKRLKLRSSSNPAAQFVLIKREFQVVEVD